MAAVDLDPSETWTILSFCYVRGVRKALRVCSDPSTAHLLQGVFPTCALEEALHQHSVGTCPATSVEHGGGDTCGLQPWPTAEFFFCAFITPSYGGAKAMKKLEELNLTTAVAGREERAGVIPSFWNRLTWSLILLEILYQSRFWYSILNSQA